MAEFKEELVRLLNKHDWASKAETPVDVLAELVYDTLTAYEKAIRVRAYRIKTKDDPPGW